MRDYLNLLRLWASRGLCGAILLLSLLACAPEENATPLATSQPGMEQSPAPEAPGYALLRARQERRLAALEQDLSESAGARATGPARRLFEGWLYHARLTGELAGFDRAAAALAELKQRTRGEPPCREQAELALASHQIEAAATALSACPGTDNRDLLIDIDYYRGDYQRAITQAVNLLEERNLPADYIRLARLRQGTGSSREADALLEAAEQRYHNDNPHQIAWFRLQRGILALERGEHERARALFRRADAALPGWWLVEEHLAEVSLLLGDTATAVALYDKVIADTGNPQFIAARAEIDRSRGRESEAQQALEQARVMLNERLQQHPAAFTGHAVDFFLTYGPPSQALNLARADYQQRPYGNAATHLATALRQAGAPEEALQVLLPQLEAGWATPQAREELDLIRDALELN
ncbi:hypothetical protein FV139_19350 [Parahaliea maris]|uniref:Tetratricopeptide repeat protein n=1 Tax=Parahaliea maris TaxID=2716870 RepID=A0A5C8ZQ07_9GAMM|nr:hypothetical protein [Parahaliea maris]TXS89884.1 hypothetical protein FV139_19350 [Parahaliea maris]